MTPPHNGTDTSIGAAVLLESVDAKRQRVFAAIKTSGDSGSTREELEVSTGMSGNTIRPRVWELMKDASVYEEGTRPTRCGRKAAVLKARAPRVRENGETMVQAKETKNVAPAMRPVSITLTAGEWEILYPNNSHSNNEADDLAKRVIKVEIRTQLAKAGVY